MRLRHAEATTDARQNRDVVRDRVPNGFSAFVQSWQGLKIDRHGLRPFTEGARPKASVSSNPSARDALRLVSREWPPVARSYEALKLDAENIRLKGLSADLALENWALKDLSDR
jgi:hypothetical protein